jgi:signal peptidase I
MKKNLLNSIVENVKTIFYALIIAVIIRSLLFQPFYIPSSSMEPTLLIGDRIFVSKYSYGYSKHSFPFSPPFYNKRIFAKKPKRGDLVVFKTPADNRTDYIKRLIGLPGDTIQFLNNELLLNGKVIKRKIYDLKINNRCGPFNFEYDFFIETLPGGTEHVAAYKKTDTYKNNKIFKVPGEHYFFMGDNRDCSNDSRIDVGYVHKLNLVGKAQIIFFSNDTISGSILKFWNWDKSIRLERFFKVLK